MATTYRIVKFSKDIATPEQDVIGLGGLTLEQAQAHCSRDDTAGDDWFHGYREET